MQRLWKLQEGLEVMHLSNYNDISWLTLLIPIGSNHDNEDKGMAHLLEHSLIHSVKETMNFPIGILGITQFDKTLYRIKCFQQDLVYISIRALIELWAGNYLCEEHMKKSKSEILLEIVENEPIYANNKILLDEIGLSEFLPVGIAECIQKTNYNQLENFHKKNYISSNCTIIWCGPLEKKTLDFLNQNSIRQHIRTNISDACSHQIQHNTIYSYHILNKALQVFIPSHYIMTPVTNISLDIMSDYLEKLLKKIHVRNFSCRSGVRVYDNDHKYICFEIYSDNAKIFNHIFVKSLPQKLYTLIKSDLSDFSFLQYINREIEQLGQTFEITNSEITNQAIYSIMYNSPIFENESYKKAYLSLSKSEILQFIKYHLLGPTVRMLN